MSHCGTSSFYNHLGHCFVVFKHIQQSFLMRKSDVWGNKVNIIQNMDHSSRLVAHVILVTANNKFPRFYHGSELFPKTKTIRSHKSRAGIPSNLNPASKRMISDSVELCETQVCFLNIQLIRTNVQCSTWSGFRVLKISCKIGVLTQSQPALFCSITHVTILFVFTCMMNIRYQAIQALVTGSGPFRNRSCKFVHWPQNIKVFQYVPSTSISENFESILLTILLQISILPLWNDGHRCMESIICRVVASSCWLTHNIVPHIFGHDPPYRRTTKKYEDFEVMEVFLFFPLKLAIRTWFCNCPQYLCLFQIVVECIPSIHDPGKMLVLPNRLLYWVLSTSDQYFCFLPANLMSSTCTDKNNPFSRCTKRHSNLETFSQPYFNRIFSNCLSHNSPAKGWLYRFRSRGTTGSSILDHDLGRGRRIQTPGHSDFWIFNNLWASSIFTWV